MGPAYRHEHLAVKKNLFALHPTQLLSIVQKKPCVDWPKEMFKKYDHGASKYVYDILTGDESWIDTYEPKSKQQSTVWLFQDKPNPTKVARRTKHFQANDCLEKLGMSQSYH